MIVLPGIRYRVFWYAISETEIDLQKGIIFTTRSVVPMRRVQSLRTERGPIADHFRMANLKIRTAAGSVSFSGLDRDEADAVCARISQLCLLVLIGVRADGRKELVALADGYRESTESWADLLRDAARRGMHAPVLAIGDGALGFWGALREVFPQARTQRCWFHYADLRVMPTRCSYSAGCGSGW